MIEKEYLEFVLHELRVGNITGHEALKYVGESTQITLDQEGCLICTRKIWTDSSSLDYRRYEEEDKVGGVNLIGWAHLWCIDFRIRQKRKEL